MDALCLDVLHSDWHDYRGSSIDEDRLLRPGWLEHVLTRWELPFNTVDLLDEKKIADMQALRTLMENMVQAFIQKQEPEEAELAALNTHLKAAPATLELIRDHGTYRLQEVPLRGGWSWVIGQVAISFAELLAQHDTARIKQCENPDCRWIYYDESANQTRRWCEDTCANLMRVRKHRRQHQGKLPTKSR